MKQSLASLPGPLRQRLASVSVVEGGVGVVRALLAVKIRLAVPSVCVRGRFVRAILRLEALDRRLGFNQPPSMVGDQKPLQLSGAISKLGLYARTDNGELTRSHTTLSVVCLRL
jgi:hypothetical protein